MPEVATGLTCPGARRWPYQLSCWPAWQRAGPLWASNTLEGTTTNYISSHPGPPSVTLEGSPISLHIYCKPEAGVDHRVSLNSLGVGDSLWLPSAEKSGRGAGQEAALVAGANTGVFLGGGLVGERSPFVSLRMGAICRCLSRMIGWRWL